jgi:hypothetical protein
MHSRLRIELRMVLPLCLAAWLSIQVSSACSAEPVDPLVGALQGAIAKNLEHAREWLDAKDFKSLAQSAGGLQMLAGLLRARSDDAAWKEATGNVSAAVGQVQEAAKSEDAAKCKAALDALEKQVSVTRAVMPSGKPQAPPTIGAIRPVMLLMDGIYADAKIYVIAGNTVGAKKQAHVLSELGRVVSNSQSTNSKGRDKWPELSGAFVEACLTAARSPAEDAPAVRQLLRGISQRCEACHETR